MDTDQKILRLGVAVIIGAVLLHLIGNGQLPDREQVAKTMLFLQTGRRVQTIEPKEIPTQPPTESTEAVTVPQETMPQPAVLTAADVAAVAIHNLAGYPADVEKLMQQITKKLWEEREGCGRRLR